MDPDCLIFNPIAKIDLISDEENNTFFEPAIKCEGDHIIYENHNDCISHLFIIP